LAIAEATTLGRVAMANFLVSYDLNGPHPSHEEMDKHLEKLDVARARILETVWYVGYQGTQAQLLNYIKQILSQEDLLIVVDAKSATWTKLLIDSDSLKEAWRNNA
jgi:hypothetical protein